MYRSLALAALAACVGVGTDAADADVPDREASYVDSCIVACPAGDVVFVVIARQVNGMPWPFGLTTVHLCDCPHLVLAAVPPGGAYMVSGCSVWDYTFPDGVSSFPLAAGGLCSGASILVECDGIPFATLPAVATFDQDGDLMVGAADVALVQDKLGSSDATADFDCDGTVTTADQAIAAAHVGHAHDSVVAVGDDPDLAFGVWPARNPTRGPTEFVVRTPAGGTVVLAIYNVAGRRVASVLDGEIEPGVHNIPWSVHDAGGRRLPPGLYLYRLRLEGQEARGTLIVTR